MFNIKSIADLGDAVRQQRTEANITQMELAEKVGCTRSIISNIEHGRGNTTLRILLNVMQALGLTLTAGKGKH